MARDYDERVGTGGWPPATPRLWARAFGRAEDLDVDFRAPRPHVVTQILARCASDAAGRPSSEDELWRWTVPQRTQGLLAVARACSFTSVAALARCADCGERIELGLELESFAQAAEQTECTWDGGSARIALRLPTGDDQRRWLAAAPADAAELPLAMASSLVCEVDGAARDDAWQLPEPWLPGVEDALAEHDPLTALNVTAACAGCGGELSAEIDLEALLLQELARAQQELLSDVHALASAYHWSEPQILRLPAWRRARYLAALRGEA